MRVKPTIEFKTTKPIKSVRPVDFKADLNIYYLNKLFGVLGFWGQP
jgi:hypothetical protein